MLHPNVETEILGAEATFVTYLRDKSTIGPRGGQTTGIYKGQLRKAVEIIERLATENARLRGLIQ